MTDDTGAHLQLVGEQVIGDIGHLGHLIVPVVDVTVLVNGLLDTLHHLLEADADYSDVSL